MEPVSIFALAAFVAALVTGVMSERAEGEKAERLLMIGHTLVVVATSTALWMSFNRKGQETAMIGVVAFLLLAGGVIYWKSRNHREVSLGKAMRHSALLVVVLALTLGILDALNIVQDHNADIDDVPEGAVQRANA